jgi:hypothetical protein
MRTIDATAVSTRTPAARGASSDDANGRATAAGCRYVHRARSTSFIAQARPTFNSRVCRWANRSAWRAGRHSQRYFVPVSGESPRARSQSRCSYFRTVSTAFVVPRMMWNRSNTTIESPSGSP